MKFYQGVRLKNTENLSHFGLQKYETLKFQRGYAKNAPQIVVEVKDIELSGEFDINGKIIADESVFTIYLGKIIEKINI